MKRWLRKKILPFFIKLGLVVALLYFLSQKGLVSFQATQEAFQKYDLMLSAAGLLFLATLITAIRWRILLRAHDIPMSFFRTLEFTLVGNFFNVALPGAVSGDVVKAIYVGKEVPGKRAAALSSILFDRVAGVSGLIFVSVGALIVSMVLARDSWQTTLVEILRYFWMITGAGVIGFYAYLFLVKEHQDPLLLFFQKLETKWDKLGSFTRIYQGLRQYHHDRAAVLWALAISILTHLIFVTACLYLLKALGETQLDPLALYTLIPLGLLVTAIPIMPAGMGTGHAAFLALFHLLGSERGVDLFNLVLIYRFLEGAVGGLVYLRFKSHLPLEEESFSPATSHRSS